MEQVYFYCAVIGGGLLLLQVLMMLVGGADADLEADVGPDVDADVVDADPSRVLLQLSLKTVIAFVTFFGLAGMICVRSQFETATSLAVASGAGLLAFFLVGQAMQTLHSLQSVGNADATSAVGQTVRVDLRIPSEHAGAGKVLVVVGGRLVARKAVTSGDAIPTGAEVVITGMASPDTYEVTPQR